jgi:hypothetical protein
MAQKRAMSGLRDRSWLQNERWQPHNIEERHHHQALPDMFWFLNIVLIYTILRFGVSTAFHVSGSTSC